MMAVRLFVALVILAAAGTFPSHAADLSEQTRAKVSDFSYELTECYAYYAYVSKCAENSNAPDLAQSSKAVEQRLLPLIYATGKTAGLLSSALLGRTQMALDSMNAQTGGTCVNIAALYLKYARKCKAMVEDPDARLRQILGR